jgi:hypothetical protein
MVQRGSTLPPPTDSSEALVVVEEILVADARSGLTPAQMVEDKLVSLLRGTPLSMSRRQSAGPVRSLSFPEQTDQPDRSH